MRAGPILGSNHAASSDFGRQQPSHAADQVRDTIAVRMPGFGPDGPWRDYVGWALNIEQVSAMTAATGYPRGPPCNVQGPRIPSSACMPG